MRETKAARNKTRKHVMKQGKPLQQCRRKRISVQDLHKLIITGTGRLFATSTAGAPVPASAIGSLDSINAWAAKSVCSGCRPRKSLLDHCG